MIFYDPFSIHTNVALWSEEAFQRIFEYCRWNEVQLLDYSASTAVRATLLGEEWLSRWERSDAKVAQSLSTSDEKVFEEKIRGHAQFRASEV